MTFLSDSEYSLLGFPFKIYIFIQDKCLNEYVSYFTFLSDSEDSLLEFQDCISESDSLLGNKWAHIITLY